MPDETLPVWCEGEDWCALTCAARLLGKKWHPVIISRLMADGPLGFNELKRRTGQISSKVLSDSLDTLEEEDLVDREIVNEKPVRVNYSLTEQGRSLEPVIDAMRAWGEEHLEPSSPEESVI